MKSDLDSDLFWHMATGRWILENLSFPTADMFSYVYRGATWINLPWIFQVSAFTLNNLFGYFGVLLLCTTAGSLSAILTWKSFELLSNSQKNHTDEMRLNLKPFGFFIFSLFLLFLEKRWVVRPELFTGLFIASEIYIISQFCLNPKKHRLLWLLPLIQLFWANSHGMFILGYALIGAAWLKHPKQMTVPLILSMIAALGNPYGLNGALYPFYLRAVSADPVYRLIREGQGLFDSTTSTEPQLYWCVWLISLLFSFKPGIRTLGKGYLLIAAFAIYFSTTMVRNLAPSVLMTMPFILQGVVENLAPYLRKIRLPRPVTVNRVIICYAFFFGTLVVTGALQFLRSDFHFGVEIASSQDLGGAAEFITKNKITQRVLATPEFSNYMLWFSPGFETYIDTRYAEVVPKSHFTRLFQLFLNPVELEEEASKYGITTIALTHTLSNYHRAIQYFQYSNNWRLAYFDQYMTIFLKKGFREEIGLTPQHAEETLNKEVSRFSALSFRSHDDFARVYQLIVGATLLGHVDLVVSLFPKIIDKADLSLQKLYCSTMPYSLSKSLTPEQFKQMGDTAKATCQTAFDKSKDHSTAYNLGIVFLKMHDYKNALNYLQVASHQNPNVAHYYISIAETLALIDDKKYSKEIENSYIKSIELNPFQANAWIALSAHYESFNQVFEAHKILEKGLTYNSQDQLLKEALRNLELRINFKR